MPSVMIGRGVASRVRRSKRLRNAELVSKQRHLKRCFAAVAVAAAAILPELLQREVLSEAHYPTNRGQYCAKHEVSSSFRGCMNVKCI